MAKKGVILVMSCNQERFINEEIIIKKTWGKAILEGKYPNLFIYFYRGGEELIYNEDEHLLLIDCNDDLSNTFIKTQKALKWVENNIIDFDYIIRVNTSTYINIKAILSFLEMDNIDDEMLCGNGLIINNSNKSIPFLRGQFLIMPKKIVSVLVQDKNIKKGVDDAAISVVLYGKYGNKYLKEHCREIDAIVDLTVPYFEQLSKAYFVRVKDENNCENNIVRMIGLHLIYETLVKDVNINPPHKFTNIETIYGIIPI